MCGQIKCGTKINYLYFTTGRLHSSVAISVLYF
jgi:hypothetical protein